jgi:ketosteroid isomerase-like protein
MSGASAKAKTNEDLMRQVLAAFQAGDMARFSTYLAPGVFWTVPGRSLLAGVHRGPDGVVAFLGKVMQLSGGTFRPDVHHILSGDDAAAYVSRDTAERHGKRLDARVLLHVSIRDGKWVEARDFIDDLYAWDAFWS